MVYDLVIRGGTIITSGDTVQMDVGVVGNKIAALDQKLDGRQVIDAGGLFVLPGAIDPHVHLEMSNGVTVSSDDFHTGTIAAACGGTTSVIDFIEPEGGESMLEALAKRRRAADGKAVIDYGLHMTLDNTLPETLAQIPGVIAAGVSSFKSYTVYAFKMGDGDLLAGFEAIGKAGGMAIVHAENDAIVSHFRNKLIAEGKTGPASHPVSRPDFAEGETVERVLSLAKAVDAPIYIVHTSTALGAAAIARARANHQRVFGETCPQYLLLTDQEFERPGFEGAKFVCAPPLRKAKDNLALWKALSRREIQTVGTDHCPFFYEGQKDLGKDVFTNIPGGIPGIEARLSLLYTFGVSQGWLSLNHWVDACSTMPARLFGLYPRKGTLLPGADADIVLFDPQREVTLSADVLHENVDYTPYEGLKLRGFPVTTIVNGKVLVQEGKLVGDNQGVFLERGKPQI